MRGLFTCLLTIGSVACSGDSSDVHVSGTVTIHAYWGGGQCSAVGGAKVTFRDGGGNVIGTTSTTGPTPGESFDKDDCSKVAPYSLDLPHVDFYEAQVGTLKPLAPMSYDELAAQDFQLNFDVATSGLRSDFP